VKLQDIYPVLENIKSMLTIAFDVEVAIIDKDCKLVTSTEKYLYYKGRDVHRFSVEEAFREGRLIISKPGFMESCRGCRFQFNCPSSVELVQPIGPKGKPIGIISVTSFQKIKDGERDRTIETYEKVLGYAANVIDFSLKSAKGVTGTQIKNKLSLVKLPIVEPIIGDSKIMIRLKEKLKKVSRTSSNILITGETGTGKELFAKTIHANGARAQKPFIPVNCAAIPDTLLESELFGYEAGAFTGALNTGNPGLFEQAHKGTLFLDEIGDMPMPLQAKILRVLQDKKVRRIGGSGSFNADVRIICATNQDLKQLMSEGRFRVDLFYRIGVVPFHIPPLRERKEDIISLALFFLTKLTSQMDLNSLNFSEKALTILDRHIWPGNARELENAVEYALNMSQETMIEPIDLPDSILEYRTQNTSQNRIEFMKHQNQAPLSYKEALSEFEKQLFTATLEETGSDLDGKRLAAQKLGLGLRTLYRKLEQHQTGD
jgi:transcriptional regulator with PAS, ATPase and Fis domain